MLLQTIFLNIRLTKEQHHNNVSKVKLRAPQKLFQLFQGESQAAAAAKLLQWCPTLYNPIDSSLPGSPILGILQARTLEWFAISFSNAWKWKVKVKLLSRVWLLATPWTAAYQASPSIGFSERNCKKRFSRRLGKGVRRMWGKRASFGEE